MMSMAQILAEISTNNPAIISQQKRLELYPYTAAAARAWMAPMVGAGIYMTPYPGQMLMNPADKGALMFQLEQEIPSFGRLAANEKYILSQGEVEKSSLAINLNALKAQARVLVATWLINKQKLSVLDSSKQTLMVLKKVEQIRFPYNQGELSKIYQADIKLKDLENQKLAIEAEIQSTRSWLNALMNKPFDFELEIDSTYTPQFVTGSLQPESLAKSNWELQKMEREITSMQLKLDVLKRQGKPSFKIRFDHSSPLAKAMPNAFSVMGMFSLPIAPWSAKMYKSEAKAMGIEIEAAQLQKQAILRAGQGQLYGMQAQIIKMQQQIRAMEQQIIPILQKNLQLAFISYRENKTNINEVLMALEAEQMMQRNLLDEKLKMYFMIADYDKELYR
jgi:outer membrane protein TolC